MPQLRCPADLDRLRDQLRRQHAGNADEIVITIGMGTCGIAAGARETMLALTDELTARGIHARIAAAGCIGVCVKEPLVDIRCRNGPRILYANIQPDKVSRLIDEHLLHNRPVAEWVFGCIPSDIPDTGDKLLANYFQSPTSPPTPDNLPLLHTLPLFSKQFRIALANCGLIDPEQIHDYILRDGYRALAKILAIPPDDLIRDMKASGLRGRGGAGFLTGAKWETCRKAPGNVKYVVCNADEGDPGAFMDRSILESDPHAVLEGMLIAAFAIGAHQGFIYCREEYPLAIERLNTALAQSREMGLLGENILGSGFHFDIEIKEGAGAFVCGEETALLASIEGRRGEPRPRPPFPAASGLWNKPTSINNVKSYAMTPQIFLKGHQWFNHIGTPKSPGTAVFALTGKIQNTGLIEVPMGIPLGDIIFDVGGGVPRGKLFKAVQTGGPLGGCLPASALNTPVEFESLVQAGAVMGSGGMIVVDDDTCMVELAKYFLTFAAAESCGKCIPCRVGGQRLLEVLTRLTEGNGARKDLDTIRKISNAMSATALCGLGQRTAGPVMAALRFFESEFIAHIDERICPAGQCRKMARARCINTCPAGVDTPAYLALIAQGRWSEAIAVHRQRNPFPMICGRACPAFCESRCRRGEIDQPVAVRLVKRAMADHEISYPWTPERLVPDDQFTANANRKVAVIGSGPAGLTAALRLAQRGYKVTVFEKLPLPGGMLSCAIPEYRLPRDLLFVEIDNIKRAGVDIRCNQSLGRDFTLDDLLTRDGFGAVILAVGAHKSRRLNIPGEDKQGVIAGVDFLRQIALANVPGQASTLPDLRNKRVGIIGGGDVAVDVARVSLRLGAREVHVIYRRTGEDMPAAHLPEEFEAATMEGVQFHTLVNPVEVLGDTHVAGVRLQHQNLGAFDTSARRMPVPAADQTYVLDIDLLVPSISQTPDLSFLPDNSIQLTPSRTLAINEAFCTTRPGVFAAGDTVSGPATIVQAIAHGNLVASAVDHYLQTGQLAKPIFITPRVDVPQCGAPQDDPRTYPPRVPVDQRLTNFSEVELTLNADAARAEAQRCLRCDLEWLDMMKIPRPEQSPRK